MSTLESLRLQRERNHIKSDERKARRSAILYLILLLVLLFLPFLHTQMEQTDRFEGIVVDFKEDFTESAASAERSSSSLASAETSEEETEEAVEAPQEVEEVEEVQPPVQEPEQKKVEEIKKVEPIKTNTRDILTTDEPSSIKIPTAMLDVKVDDNAKVVEVSSQITEVVEEVSKEDTEKMTKEFISDISNFFKKSKKSSKKKSSSSANAGDGTSGSGEGDAPGEGSQGSSDTGDADTDGVGDSGTEGLSFDGDGLLTRKVVYRANLDKIIKESGKIVINLCVDRDGKVIYNKIDKEKSDRMSAKVLADAEKAAGRYRYEKDYTVAERQCGRLTFIVKIQK